MRWPEVIRAVAAAGPAALNLSIGTPLLVPEVSSTLASALRRLADRPDIDILLGSYAHYSGQPELIDCFVARCTRDFGRAVSPAEVVVVPGIQAALRYVHELIRGCRRRLLFPLGLEFPGSRDPLADEPPSVGSYVLPEGAPGTTQVSVDVDALDWQNVGAAILSQPHSPTGRLWTADELQLLARRAAEHDAWLVVDETYGLPFAPVTISPPPAVDAPNVIHFYSLSKMGLAAERVGVVVAPAEIAATLGAIMRQNVIQPPAVGQHLAVAAIARFEAHPPLARRFGEIYYQRWDCCRSIIAARMNDDSRLRLARWEGGPFLWCEWDGAPSCDDVFRAILARGVAVAPSSSLLISPTPTGANGVQGLRIGIGASLEELERGATAIADTLRAAL